MLGILVGLEPAAMIACLKLIRSSLPLTEISFGDSNCASPHMTVTSRCFARPPNPLVNCLMTEFFHLRSLSRSISGSSKMMPCASISRASPINFAACKSAFEGIHPTFKQTPPRSGYFSTNATFRPKSAARNAAEYPPGPDPITTKSYVIFAYSISVLSRTPVISYSIQGFLDRAPKSLQLTRLAVRHTVHIWYLSCSGAPRIQCPVIAL